VPFRIFSSRTLTGANVSGLLIGASLFSMFFFISLYMQQVLGFDALKAGLSYLPLAITIILSAGVASQLSTKLGFKPVLIFGLLLIAVGLVWFNQISANGSYVSDVLGPSIVAGAGLGFAFVPVTIAAVAGVSGEDSGLASGLINTSQQVGGALGLAILAAVANAATDNAMTAAHGARSALPAALTDGFQNAFLVGAGFAVLGALAAWLLIRTSDSRDHVGADAASVPAA
jgi:predicted MFS family arabinose efflux permease